MLVRAERGRLLGCPLHTSHTGTHAFRQADRQADRQTGRQAGRETGMQSDTQAERQAGIDVGAHMSDVGAHMSDAGAHMSYVKEKRTHTYVESRQARPAETLASPHSTLYAHAARHPPLP